MNGSEKFLKRWSHRKRKSAVPEQRSTKRETKEKDIDTLPSIEGKSEETAAPKKQKKQEEAPVFDLKSLPPIESIVAGTDIRPFLASGVPAELMRAALRRAWMTDPAIRDFIGLSENSWDFTKPESISGFGPLQMTDELRKIVTEMFEHLAPQQKNEIKAHNEDRASTKADSAEPIAELSQPQKIKVQPRDFSALPPRENTATQHNYGAEKTNDPIRRRSHGGALPK